MVKRLARVLSLVMVLGALTSFYLWSYYHTPASHEAEARIVTLAPGTNLSQIAAQLAANGLLRHRWMFVLYVRWLAPGPHLQAGEYSLSTSLSPAQITAILRSGKVRYHTLTIPEGSTIRDIATLVSALGLGNAQAIRALAHDTTFITALGLTAPSLEGYLFPETYRVQRGMRERDLLALMVQTLQANYTPEMTLQADRLGFSQHEVLTLASLIEKEAQIDDERPLIAAVYHNRLRHGMRLQCDPTVIYALGEQFDGNIRKADLQIDSPYNTYRYAGLPPGPIASAGRHAIEAALAPAAVDYLYFVAIGRDGRHKFSTTLADHNQAVREYQLKRFAP